jgi:enoyl-CoA hydratase/carnithine racemase
MAGVRTERADCIATITLDEPESRNALSTSICDGVLAALRQCEDQGVRAVIITGSGPAFCAGGDLKSMPGDGASGLKFIRGIFEWFEAVQHCRVPLIAAVNGPAMGGGAELVLACDLAVAAENAVFGFPETQVGLMAPFAAARLPTVVPPVIAKELTMTGRVLTAADAAAFGLVNKVVPAEQLLAAASELAGRIATRSALATAITKELLNQGGQLTADRAARASAPLFGHEDTRQRIQAFIDKRPGSRSMPDARAPRLVPTNSEEDS